MRNFSSRMSTQPGRQGNQWNHRGGNGRSQQENTEVAQETFNPMTSSFFGDLDTSGRSRQHFSYQPQNTAGGSWGANTYAADEALVEDAEFVPRGATGDKVSGKQTQDTILWIELGLCKALTRAVSHLGFIAPTPVQTQAIPAIMSGADCCVRAVTGSGKTGAFMLPLLHQLLTRSPVKQSMMTSKRRFIRALVLVPSRELGVQCHEMTKQMMSFTTEIRTALAIGGVAAHAQEAALEQAPELVIATPGRFVDIIRNYKGPYGGIDLSGVEVLCLDECDKMLTITLKDQVVDIVERIPPETRQMLLFSATMTSEVDEFAKKYLFEPKNIDIGHVALASQLRQQFVRIKVDAAALKSLESKPVQHEMDEAHHSGDSDAEAAKGGKRKIKKVTKKRRHDGDDDDERRMDSESDDDNDAGKKKKRVRSKRVRDELNADAKADDAKAKEDAELFGGSVQEHVTKIKTRYLTALCENYFKKSVLIFTKYRTTAHRLQKVFQCLGMKSAELQGNQIQEERFEALRQFVSGEANYLFCTDIASRGLDIKGVATVINFDLPPTLTAYIHRVGRTARIGAVGTAVSLVHETMDADIMRKILTVSGNINEHQVASVKRRDIPDDVLETARKHVDDVFPRVREILAAENLAQKIELAEKLLRKERSDTRATISLSEAITAKPKREWCLSKKERAERDAAARQKYEKEAEVTIQEAQQELAELSKEEGKFLQRQKSTRRQLREKKQRERDRELEQAKNARKKQAQKVQAGNVKALKKKKIREARKAQRAENREKKGRPAFKHSDGRKRNKKSRHSRGVKKH